MGTTTPIDRSGGGQATMNELWKEALEVIPGGTSTGGMRLQPELADDMPAFIDHARGCHLTDLGGREYIDYGASLGPIILGHRHPAVEEAVRAQLDRGVLFSMDSTLQAELARAILDMVHGAEMVRFLKTGADAVSACVRVARAVTGRDRVVITGYHGWHDVFASYQPSGAIQSAGVPEVVQALTLLCGHGDEVALARAFSEHPGEIAAVVALPYKWGTWDWRPPAVF